MRRPVLLLPLEEDVGRGAEVGAKLLRAFGAVSLLEDLAGKPLELRVVCRRGLHRLRELVEEAEAVGQGGRAVDPHASALVVDLVRVAGGAAQSHPVLPGLGVGVLGEADRQTVRVHLLVRLLQEIAELAAHVRVRPEELLVGGLLQCQEPLVADEARALRGKPEPLLLILAPALGEIDHATRGVRDPGPLLDRRFLRTGAAAQHEQQAPRGRRSHLPDFSHHRLPKIRKRLADRFWRSRPDGNRQPPLSLREDGVAHWPCLIATFYRKSATACLAA
jgi:hypothetical protein